MKRSSISKVRQNAYVTLAEVETAAQNLESQYVISQNPVTSLDMQAAYCELMLLRVSKAKKQHLAQSQRIFERGVGMVGSWPGWQKEQQTPSIIAHIYDADNVLLVDPLAINARFASDYSDLYSFRIDYSREELNAFLDQINLPKLSDTACERLNGFITVEVQQAM